MQRTLTSIVLLRNQQYYKQAFCPRFPTVAVDVDDEKNCRIES